MSAEVECRDGADRCAESANGTSEHIVGIHLGKGAFRQHRAESNKPALAVYSEESLLLGRRRSTGPRRALLLLYVTREKRGKTAQIRCYAVPCGLSLNGDGGRDEEDKDGHDAVHDLH